MLILGRFRTHNRVRNRLEVNIINEDENPFNDSDHDSGSSDSDDDSDSPPPAHGNGLRRSSRASVPPDRGPMVYHYLAITPGSDLVEVVTDADSDENVGECAASVPPVEANVGSNRWLA